MADECSGGGPDEHPLGGTAGAGAGAAVESAAGEVVAPASKVEVGSVAESSTAPAAEAAVDGEAEARAGAEAEHIDHVERLQTLLTRHVELFERLLFVERDINNKDNIKRISGEQSEGLLRRHPSDMRAGMLVDWHLNAINRARDETGTRARVETRGFRDGTQVLGDAAAIQLMVEALSRNTFDEFLDNREAVLSSLAEIDFVDKPEAELTQRIRALEAQRRSNGVRIKALTDKADGLATVLRERGDSLLRELLQVTDKAD